MTTATTTLADFLLARIAEDQAVANLARPDDHLDTRDRSFLRVEVDNGYAHVAATSGRVLADCDAKRRIVEGYAELVGSGRVEQEQSLWWACALLALPYADHPDFRPEWRP